MKKYFSILISGILAGILIGVASIVKVSNSMIGTITFGLGIFLIMNFGLFLYTGRIGAVLDNKPIYLLDLLVGLISNFMGAVGTGLLMRLTRFSDSISAVAKGLVEAKETDSLFSLFILGILCGFMIYLSVKAYKEIENGFAKTLAVFLCISFFVICGFEHCIADSCYYAMTGTFEWHYVLSILIIVIGNSVGSIILDLLFKGFKKFSK